MGCFGKIVNWCKLWGRLHVGALHLKGSASFQHGEINVNINVNSWKNKYPQFGDARHKMQHCATWHSLENR